MYDYVCKEAIAIYWGSTTMVDTLWEGRNTLCYDTTYTPRKHISWTGQRIYSFQGLEDGQSTQPKIWNGYITDKINEDGNMVLQWIRSMKTQIRWPIAKFGWMEMCRSREHFNKQSTNNIKMPIFAFYYPILLRSVRTSLLRNDAFIS